ncbi:glycoside hydrolase family 20 protein [Sediminibacterium sp.]|uniref:glycoside hydrolase family 20 protein n=1 Tax=Sediminibacterium sp. TaxID=1917865 RepID=UPI003F6A1E4F
MKYLFLVFFLPLSLLAQTPQIDIIPVPVHLQQKEGRFTIQSQTPIQFLAASKELSLAAQFLQKAIHAIAGYALPIQPQYEKKGAAFSSNGKLKNQRIVLRITKDTSIGVEGYHLTVTENQLIIEANTKAGIIFGIQSLLQTLPAIQTNAKLEVPCMQVTDYPRFAWRGMHLDVSRHFFGPDVIKQYLDLLAAYKFNTFHWHLVDDQGWRIEIKKYPALNIIGAWRVDQNHLVWGERPQAKEGEAATYGGYYTQEQIKAIIAYATERNITVVPEIEMPGHVASAIAAYPALSCTQQKQLPLTGGNYTGMSSNYCAGNDSVFHFLEGVLTEVINLFPSKYIHIGGDEVDKSSWKKCAKCQERIRAEKLKDEEELQSYFIKRIERFINSKGRKIIGWDEILEGGLAPDATVMSWRGEAGGIAAAKMKHDVVMTPGNPVYFDHYQGDPASEPIAIGGFNTLKRVYDYEPLPKELTNEEARYVLGAQANLWTEYVTTPKQVQYMVLPRMLALSEVLWSPAENKNWASFNNRLQTHFKSFDQKGLHYSKGNFKVDIKPVLQKGILSATLATEAYQGQIYYTTDGTEPTLQSNLYTNPISIQSSVTVKAVTVVNGERKSMVPAEQKFAMHQAIGKKVNYTNPISRYYMADGPNSLTDGIKGTYAVGQFWHGIAGKDLIATIDLGDVKSIQKLSLGCLQKYADWIMMPEWVRFEVSMDGSNFSAIQTIPNPILQQDKTPTIHDFTASFASMKARFVRVTAKVLQQLPKGHSGEGKPAWIFADEFIVE